MAVSPEEAQLRTAIEKSIEAIFSLRRQGKQFVPGKTWVQYAGAVYDEAEIKAMAMTMLDGWFGLGPQGELFERTLAGFIGTKGSVLTNSGSSASLLATASLMSIFLPKHLEKGDEIITPACGFPTTVNPSVQLGLIPVFLDVDPETYNIDPKDYESALSDKTRAMIIPHTLGNPNNMDALMEFAKAHDLFVIEDNCDALGSLWNGKKTGSFGIMATESFYPAHHMTIGEGGAVFYQDARLERIIKSLRDWGRACYCRGDEKRHLGTCGVRFNFKVGGQNYDHKYMFNAIGWNLKPVEFQAAMGVVQLARMPHFIAKRKHNFDRLFEYFKRWEEFFILPKSLPQAEPCWFAMPLTIRENAPFDRHAITTYLEERLIQTRPLFAGNILLQPAYRHVTHRKIGDLPNATRIMYNTFFIGVYPGLEDEHLDYMMTIVEEFMTKQLGLSSHYPQTWKAPQTV